MPRQITLAIAISTLLFSACALAPEAEHYSMEDFAQVRKIDAHVHLHGSADGFMAQALRDRVDVLTINVDYPDFPSLEQQQRDAVSLLHRYPGHVAFAAAFPVADFQSPTWATDTVRRLDESLALGAIGVKVWKNIGMGLRDPDGRFVMLDDPRFEPVWAHLEQRHVVLLGHQAEPLNCWLAPEQMTVKSDREYFHEHPQYYMFLHPEFPSHEAQLAARDRVLARHPDLRFVGVHLASLEWDVDEVARFLDRFPHASVDLAARMVHLQYQAVHNRDKVRDFLIRYQDRILYGTDIATVPGSGDADAAGEARDAWRQDWRFLNTAETMTSPDFAGAFRGLELPRAVVQKIYAGNALALFPGAWPSDRVQPPGPRGSTHDRLNS